MDLQLLRAVAVAMVVVYHLWPSLLPGGFVGVDIFFVISGFLITSHLVTQAESPEGIRPLRFWAKRALRLLPMACLVLIATAWAVYAWMPPSSWKGAVSNILASAFYVQNWALAGDAVNYLARDSAPLPTQHFWSLSVEEQFYIAWPLLLLTSLLIAKRVARRRGISILSKVQVRRAIFFALVVVLLCSLATSLLMTFTAPTLAYFATTTRAWEFASGGLLVFLAMRWKAGSRPQLFVRITASWTGFAIIVATAGLLTASIPFPGFVALLPVVGASLLIWAGDVPFALVPTILARFRPVTYLGDISYGIYLWHWPLIVILPLAVGTELGTPLGLAIVAASVVLAAASKALIEDPIRFGSYWKASTVRGFVPALTGMVTVCFVVGIGVTLIDRSSAPSPDSESAGVSSELPSSVLEPAVALRGEDRGNMYDCFDLTAAVAKSCTYGPADASVSIAITGDSHAAHLIPALSNLAEENGWRLTTYVGMNCDAGLSDACPGAAQQKDSIVQGDYDLVLVSSYRGSYSPEGGVEEYWSNLIERGVRILPIADVPLNPQAAFDCIDSSAGDPARAALCTVPVQQALFDVPDRVAPLASRLGIAYADFTDLYCDATLCQSVIDGDIVYQDSPSSHLTATYSRLLAPRLGIEIVQALNR